MPSPISSFFKEDYAYGEERAKEATKRVTPHLTQELAKKELKLGAPVFIRIFKDERAFEIWVQTTLGEASKKFKTYRIAAMSGKLGPKLAGGDRQSPEAEGFYAVSLR